MLGPDAPTRRQVLRWMGAAGLVAAAPPVLTACIPASTPQPLAPDAFLRSWGFVGGADVEIGPGAWCWFQAPRASFGPGGLLWLGASVAGTGTAADGAVKVLAYEVPTSSLVVDRTLATVREDDHTSPSVLALGDEVQVSWAAHMATDWVEIATTDRTGAFSSQRLHRAGSTRAPARGTSYASVHVVKGVRYLLYRGEHYSWNLLTSPDGKTWKAHGLVVTPRSSGDRPYLHAASDGNRLHLLVNDGNPTEFRGTSVYAGTLESDLTLRRNGTKIGTVGSGAPVPSRFQRLAVGVVGATEADDTDMWICDLRVVDGRPTGIVVRRDPWPAGSAAVGSFRHRYYWVRLRADGWWIEFLGFGGGELYVRQPDYAGLATQDPSDPTRVVISTNVHPVTGAPLTSQADGRVHFELYEGVRTGERQWRWEALTVDSTEDNLRPFIAAGGAHKALAWMRGRYWSWTAANTRMCVRAAVDPAQVPTTTTTVPTTTTTTEGPTSTTTTEAPTSTTTEVPTSTTTSTTIPAEGSFGSTTSGGPGALEDGG